MNPGAIAAQAIWWLIITAAAWFAIVFVLDYVTGAYAESTTYIKP